MTASQNSVFVDTVLLVGLANRDDQLHEECSRLWLEQLELGAELVTSDWVLSEFLGGAARVPLRKAAVRIVDKLTRSARVEIVPATRAWWIGAFEFYRDRPDKEWSFVDCSSILLCHERKIQSVLTQDRHFVQAGLTTLIAPK